MAEPTQPITEPGVPQPVVYYGQLVEPGDAAPPAGVPFDPAENFDIDLDSATRVLKRGPKTTVLAVEDSTTEDQLAKLKLMSDRRMAVLGAAMEQLPDPDALLIVANDPQIRDDVPPKEHKRDEHGRLVTPTERESALARAEWRKQGREVRAASREHVVATQYGGAHAVAARPGAASGPAARPTPPPPVPSPRPAAGPPRS